MAGGGTLAAYAAASMRLHQQLALLLDDAEPPLGSPLVAQAAEPVPHPEPEPHPSLHPEPEPTPTLTPTPTPKQADASALRALRRACVQKPQGTVAGVLQQASQYNSSSRYSGTVVGTLSPNRNQACHAQPPPY